MNKMSEAEMFKILGKLIAEETQKKFSTIDSKEIPSYQSVCPSFEAAKEKLNMLNRPAGFVCISPDGRVVKLLQPYDSNIYPQNPEELPAQWGFLWSKDPEYAQPFIALSTSPYSKDDCCEFEGRVYRSTMDNNVWSPADYAQGWEEVTNDATVSE